MQDGYKRNLNLANAGFTSGPCLLKDTMQLSSFLRGKFQLGHEAMKINEGLPIFLINALNNLNCLSDSLGKVSIILEDKS